MIIMMSSSSSQNIEECKGCGSTQICEYCDCYIHSDWQCGGHYGEKDCYYSKTHCYIDVKRSDLCLYLKYEGKYRKAVLQDAWIIRKPLDKNMTKKRVKSYISKEINKFLNDLESKGYLNDDLIVKFSDELELGRYTEIKSKFWDKIKVCL